MFSWFSLVCLAVWGGLSGVQGQEDLRERVQQLETQVRKTTEELEQVKRLLILQEKLAEEKEQQAREARQPYREIIEKLRQEAAQKDSVLPSLRSSLATLEDRLELHGYAELLYRTDNDPGDTPEFDAAVLALTLHSEMNDFLSFDAELLLENGEAFRPGYAQFNLAFHPALNLQTGIILVPLGRFNTWHDPPVRHLTSPPDVGRYLIPAVWAEPGVAIGGQLNLPWGVTMQYQCLLSNGLTEEGFTATEGNRPGRPSLHRDNNRDKQVSGRLDLILPTGTETIAWQVGMSGLIGRYDDETDSQVGAWAIDGLMKIGSFSLVGDHDELEITGEYVDFRLERDAGVIARQPDIVGGMSGFYFELRYSFFPESWRSLASFLNEESRWSLAFRYEESDLDENRRGSTLLDDRRIYTVGASFRPFKRVVFKWEYGVLQQYRRQQRVRDERLLASFSAYF